MSESRESPDELELKKRARRRLVGAVAFATLAAVVLPMVMDDAPPPAGHDIELRIPGQDQVTSSPLTMAGKPPAEPAAKANPPAPTVAEKPPVTAATTPPVTEKPARKAEPVAAKPTPKSPAVEAAKPPSPPKTAENLPRKDAQSEARRAQAILEGQGAASPAAESAHVILIGAFSDATNVKNLQTKLGQLGIKTYTESLESSQGRKTRVRAGPFANRDLAEKALDKMKRIGVSGVVAPKS